MAAVAVTQSLRDEGIVISDVRSDPGDGKCPGYEPGTGIPISFFLNRDDVVSAAIVGVSRTERARKLFSGRRLKGGRRHCVLWDARDEGGLALSGVYRLEVSLEEADRVAVAGERIRIPRARRQGLLSP